MKRALSMIAILVSLSASHAQAYAEVAAPALQTQPPSGSGTPYTAAIQAALTAVANNDYDTAFTQLRQAASFSSDEPLAYYYMAELHRVRGSLADSLEMFRTASRLADSGTDFQMQGRARLGIAQCLEQMEGHMEEARAAWEEYVRFAGSHPSDATAEWGRTRLQSINIAHEQEDVYVGVRQRIATRAQEVTRAAAAARNAPPARPATPRR